MMIALLFSCFTAFAQNAGKPYVQLNAGLAGPLLDGGSGVTLGINPCLPIWRGVHLEGQLSGSRVNVTNGFLSGDTGRESGANLLLGGRLYLAKPEKKLRPYVNFLLGGNFVRTESDASTGFVVSEGFQAGLSTGVYVMGANGLSAGFALETPGYYALKVGYVIGGGGR